MISIASRRDGRFSVYRKVCSSENDWHFETGFADCHSFNRGTKSVQLIVNYIEPIHIHSSLPKVYNGDYGRTKTNDNVITIINKNEMCVVRVGVHCTIEAINMLIITYKYMGSECVSSWFCFCVILRWFSSIFIIQSSVILLGTLIRLFHCVFRKIFCC